MTGCSTPSPPCLHPQTVAPGSDVRTDLPRYRVWRDGVLAEEVDDIRHLWIPPPSPGGSGAAAAAASAPPPHPDARSDWVAFLLGCSFSFESALLAAGLPVRHLQEERGSSSGQRQPAAAPPAASHAAACPKNVPMYATALECEGAGPFRGPLVVSMRPMTPQQVRPMGAPMGTPQHDKSAPCSPFSPRRPRPTT